MGPYLKKLRSMIGHECIMLPGVRAILQDSTGQILLQKRSDVNLWGLPAGSVELNETALEAVKREVLEETALEIIDPQPIGLCSGPTQKFEYPNGDAIQGFALLFLIRKWNGTAKPDGQEGTELKFFPANELPENMVEIHTQTLDSYRKYDGSFILLP